MTAPPVRRGPSYAVEREFDKADYLRAVERAKEYIAAGDMMQVQIGQRLKKRYTQSPLALYRALRRVGVEVLAGIAPGDRVAIDPIRAGLAGARPAASGAAPVPTKR